MMNKLSLLLVVIFAFNLGTSIFTGNINAIAGWFCALLAQIQLLNFGE